MCVGWRRLTDVRPDFRQQVQADIGEKSTNRKTEQQLETLRCSCNRQQRQRSDSSLNATEFNSIATPIISLIWEPWTARDKDANGISLSGLSFQILFSNMLHYSSINKVPLESYLLIYRSLSKCILSCV